MAAITRANLMKELLPGLNKLFGMEYEQYSEDYEVSQIRQEIEESGKEFIDRETYLRVVRNYEERLAKDKTMQDERAERKYKEGIRAGWERAASTVEEMANEVGTSNILHATALAVRAKAEEQ